MSGQSGLFRAVLILLQNSNTKLMLQCFFVKIKYFFALEKTALKIVFFSTYFQLTKNQPKSHKMLTKQPKYNDFGLISYNAMH